MANTKAILLLLGLLPILVIARQLNRALYSSPHLFPAGYNTKDDSLILPFKARYSPGDSIAYYFIFITGICKGNYYTKHVYRLQALPVQVNPGTRQDTVLPRALPDIHGDVSYDFFYRSAPDTAYAGSDITQHSTRANIYATIGKTLPVVIHIATRHGNSGLLKNYTDVGIEFNGQTWQSELKENLKAKITEQIRQKSLERCLYTGLQKKYALQQQLGQWLQSSRQIQQLMDIRQLVATMTGSATGAVYNGEALEAGLKRALQDSFQNVVTYTAEKTNYTQWMHKGAALTGHLKNFSFVKKRRTSPVGIALLNDRQEKAIAYLKEYIATKEKYKEISEEVQHWEEQYNKAKSAVRQAIDSARQRIDATNDPDLLQSQVKKYGLDSNRTYRRIKQLMAIKRFSIGRSMVDGSELSAKHISVTGINAVYNTRFYYAVTAGTVDYRYRNFIMNRNRGTRQWLALASVGIGKKEGNSLVLTAYRGSEETAGFANNNVPLVSPVQGITLEGKYYINRQNYIVAEIAKSSYPKNGLLRGGTGRSAKLSSFSDRSNEAYSVQLFFAIPSAGTRIFGQYKYMGSNFQSFTVFNGGTQYSLWQLSADQYFFKRILFLTASVKNNEYNSPYAIYNYKSNTVFKSIRATLRMKNWPVIAAGYMPASQLSKTDSGIMETRFNMIMATVGYAYRVNQYHVHVSAIYNKFFNDAAQQKFVYYNATTWILNHSITRQQLTLNTIISVARGTDYSMISADKGIQCVVNKWMVAGGGLKLSRMNTQPVRWGYYGNAQLQLNKHGKLGISFDRSFLPGMSQTLLVSDMFRIIYFKTF